MDIARVRYFLVVAKHQSMTRASEELHVAEPAVSQAMKRLSEELGFPLFERKGRNIQLTRQGESFYDMVLPILEKLDEVPGRILGEKDKSEDIIRVSVDGLNEEVDEIIEAYRSDHPDVKLKVVSESKGEPWDVKVISRICTRENPNSRYTPGKAEFISYLDKLTEQLNLA